MQDRSTPQRFTGVRLLLFVLGLGFLLMVIYAIATDSITEQGAVMMGLIWGQVALVDLYLGFVISLILLWYLELRRLYVVIFGLILMVMGNWLLCWYLAWRWPHLRGVNGKTGG